MTAGRRSPGRFLNFRARVAAFVEQRFSLFAPLLVVLAAIVIDLRLPSKLAPIKPTWALPLLEGILLIGLVLATAHPRGRHSPFRRRVAIGLTGVVSAANVVSVILLVYYLLQPRHSQALSNGHSLIVAGFALWGTNVLLFGLWYWQIDRGGPIERNLGQSTTVDFLFPQMVTPEWAPRDWMPGLVDYLYVSFTNATAFSPTDTMPLTPLAKWLMSAQALTSLVTVGLVVARAVNIL